MTKEARMPNELMRCRVCFSSFGFCHSRALRAESARPVPLSGTHYHSIPVFLAS
jgi:hypothetical protein